jgi:ADP-dependent NAD(P)H-hydrate dehydratase / NAD(P)H-hydrate epimerase
MIPVLTAAETRELDRQTEARGVPVIELMERAGRACAVAAREVTGGAYGRRAVALCGKGNNGGDALVAARLLAGWGMRSLVVLFAEPEAVREPAGTNLRRLDEAGVRWIAWSSRAGERELERADVVLDGLFGSGFRGVAEGPYAEAIELLNRSPAPVVAVDIPSGVEGDTGAVRGPAVRADVTVTFGAPKVGDLLYPGAEHAGRVVVADIGFPEDLVRSDLLLVEAEDVRALLPRRRPDDHKHRSGNVLVVAGSRRMTGAARLVAEGAARAGAGLVHVAVPEGILPVVQSGVAESVFLPLPEGSAGTVAEAAWDVIAERMDRFDAVAVGPGMSTEEETPGFLRRLIRESSVPVVADADAITALAGRPRDAADRAAHLVLTPHAGEFARLFGVPASELGDDRVGLLRKAVEEVGAVVLLKGPRTLVGRPGGLVTVNPTGSPALATGGTGDVLTGMIATYLARGLADGDAALLGAYVHGLAGDAAGDRLGEGATSVDVARAVPEAVVALEASA